jgi:ABC-type sugar transport system substrate-binding protein
VVLSSKENYQFGKELGQAIVADSKGKDAHVAMFVTPQVPVFANEGKALKSIINSSACQGCTTGVQEFPVSDAGTKLPSKVVSYVRAHTETNYVYFDFNDAVDGVPAALQRAGLANKVKLLSNNIATTEAQYVTNGQMWAAAANPWPETLWKDFHIVLAKAQNAPMGPPKGVELPNMIVTKDNLPPLNGGMFPLVVNYQDAFKKAWHVQ